MTQKSCFKFSQGLALSASAVLILIGAILVRFGVSTFINVLVFVFGVLLAIGGLSAVVLYVRQKSKNINILLSGLLALVIGFVLIIFYATIAVYILAAVGILLIVYGVINIINAVKANRSMKIFLIIVGIVRILIGAALVLTAFNGRIDWVKDDVFIRTIGWISVGVGTVLLISEK